jgi:hypothetical protein
VKEEVKRKSRRVYEKAKSRENGSTFLLQGDMERAPVS